MPAIIRQTKIHGTRITVYSAWEAIESLTSGTHGTISHDDEHGWLGRIGTRRTEIDLPVGEERSAAVAAFYRAQHVEALEAIEDAYPDLCTDLSARESHFGEIETTEEAGS